MPEKGILCSVLTRPALDVREEQLLMVFLGGHQVEVHLMQHSRG